MNDRLFSSSSGRRNLRWSVASFWIVLLCLAALFPAGAAAQARTDFARVTVDLWPEFDRPMMLVIYNIRLGPDVALPAAVQVQIPASAGAPNAVAVCQDDGCFNTTFTQEAAGKWSTLDIQATRADLRVEYYDPDLVIEDNARHYEYIWPGGHVVDDFTVVFQKPADASDLRIKPGMVTAEQGQDSLTYYTLQVGALKAAQKVNVGIDYQKPNDRLTYPSIPVVPSGPLDTSLGGNTVLSALPLVLGLLGLLLIVGGGVWYWQSGHQPPRGKRVRRVRHKPAVAAFQPEGEAANGNVYCHQCGKRALPGDRFCRVCGTQLRLG